jgi:group I intron endonuclease
MIGIYKITNIDNNKVYIGQSKNVIGRLLRHKLSLIRNKHFNKHLQSSWNDYGESKFTFTIIEQCNINDLDKREIYWINYYNFYNGNYGYNKTLGGKGPIGCKRSHQTKLKISKVSKGRVSPNKGKKYSVEFRKKLSEIHKGKKLTETCKLNMSKSHKGKTPWNKGINSKKITFTEQQYDFICQLRASNISYKNIGYLFSCSKNVIKRLLKDNNFYITKECKNRRIKSRCEE